LNEYGSKPLLPTCRIAAAVEASDNGYCLVRLDHEHERIGKAAEQGTSNTFVNDGKLLGSSAPALDYGVDCCAETPTESRNLVLDQSCASINSARAARVKIIGYATDNAAQARLSSWPK
jgi:hypothetical protein